MSRVAFAFDLHNTLMRSNDAWIAAYLELGGEKVREQVTKAVYRKHSRREIAQSVGVSYEGVYERYCSLVRPAEDMLRLLTALKGYFPVYLISAASEDRVCNDLAVWSGAEYFDVIFTKESFCKNHSESWRRLLAEQGLELLVYIGNDAEEDIPDAPGVVSFICGDFLKSLNGLGLLINRKEAQS